MHRLLFGPSLLLVAFLEFGVGVGGFHPISSFRTTSASRSAGPRRWSVSEGTHVETLLFVECGFGADAHGQNSTKASVRACRNAIEFNQIPSIGDLVPGGRDGMKLDVILAVPPKYQQDLDLDTVRQCFPYGSVKFQVQDGGMIATNGKIIESMGDENEDMVVVCCAVSVGY